MGAKTTAPIATSWWSGGAGRHEETPKERDKLIGNFAETGKEVWSAGHGYGGAGRTGQRHSWWSPKAEPAVEHGPETFRTQLICADYLLASEPQRQTVSKVRSPTIKWITRVGQTALTLTLGLYFMLVVFGNVTDYGTNFQFVKHVLSMDSIPPDPHVAWRAIRSEALYHLTYIVIITWEAAAGLLCLCGAIRMAIHLKSRGFNDAKSHAIAGLWVGMLLWSLAFITVGGEWFMMWESATWSGEPAAIRMFTLTSIALLFLQLVNVTTEDSKAESDREV